MWPLLGALALHAFLFTVFTLSFPPPREALVFIEPPGVAQQSIQIHSKKLGPLKKGGRKSSPPLAMSDLTIGKNTVIAQQESASNGDEDSGPLAQVGKTVPLNWLYQEIDSAFSYPEEFAEAGIEGTVHIQVQFDREGTPQINRAKFRSSSNYLYVLVDRVFRSRFADLPPGRKKQVAGITLRCVFILELRRATNGFDSSQIAHRGSGTQQGALGSNFSFYRSKRVVGEWKLGPFSGYAIFPAVAIDPTWFITQVEKAVDDIKGKAPIDPLQKYRDDPAWR